MIESPSILWLSRLFHHRWAVPILAELYRTDGAKFITLVKHLDISKDALRRTLQSLIEQGLVVRNPGFGHPLSPEYLLTPDGMLLGKPSIELMRLIHNHQDIALRKWTLPVLLALAQGHTRFSGLRAALPGITSRALALALRDLEALDWLQRPTQGFLHYKPTAQAKAVVQALQQLIR